MTLRLHPTSLIVPVHLIEARYPGGLRACIDDHESLLGERVWFDRRLWRDGAPDGAGLRALVEGWCRVGLQPLARSGAGWRWHELCVVGAPPAGPTLPCDWLRIGRDGGEAWWAHAAPGPTVGPEDVVRAPPPRRAPPRPPGKAAGIGLRLLERLVGPVDGGPAPRAARRA